MRLTLERLQGLGDAHADPAHRAAAAQEQNALLLTQLAAAHQDCKDCALHARPCLHNLQTVDRIHTSCAFMFVLCRRRSVAVVPRRCGVAIYS